jgi:hypothetical protein
MILNKIKELVRIFNGTLLGIDEISKYCGYNMADVIDWIFHCGFPAKKEGEIWIADKFGVKSWLRKRRKFLKNIDKERQLTKINFNKPKQKKKRRRW